MFWEEVLSWIALCSNEVEVISFPDVFCGKFITHKDFMIIHHILLLQNSLFMCKLDKKEPSLDALRLN